MRNKVLLPIIPIIAGLLTSQVLGFLHVYLSNIELYHKLTTIKEAGYFTVPNILTMETLKEFGSALGGGLFFTLTVGASLTIITMAVIWIWINLFRKNRFALIPLFLIWMACLARANAQGFCAMATSYFIIVPLVVIISAWGRLNSESDEKSMLNVAILLFPIILLSILWSTLLIQNPLATFINIRNIRDYYLLSNPAGKSVYDFYYKYTLYASETFQPLKYKVFKTCSLLNFEENSNLLSLEKRLLNRDYLVLDTDKADLKIDKQGDELVFLNKGREVLRISQKLFLSDPGEYLKSFSDQTDVYDFFRGFTYLSILIGFPLILYLLMLTALERLFGFFKNPTTSLTIATIICLLIGIALFVPMHVIETGNLKASDIEGAMQKDRWQDNVTALREIYMKELEIMDYPNYINKKDSPHIPVRYWLVKALGVSKKKETYNDLFYFLDDPYPNVVCQALEAIGQRGDMKDIEIIVQRMSKSPHLYVQFNAYRTMRDLGWKQTKSILNN